MEKSTLDFKQPARLVYVAIRRLFQSKKTRFTNVECNDDLFVIDARRGMWLSPFSESVKIKVRATSSSSCQVFIESSSRSPLNILNIGANSGNVSDLTDYICNEVHKLCQPGEIKMRQ